MDKLMRKFIVSCKKEPATATTSWTSSYKRATPATPSTTAGMQEATSSKSKPRSKPPTTAGAQTTDSPKFKAATPE